MTKPADKHDCRSGQAHCWHATGKQLQTNPPQTEEICCWCGLMRYLQVFLVKTGGNHGRHNPDTFFIRTEGDAQ